MKKVFKYLLRVLVFLIPAWLLIVVYLITDPFKVIHTNSPFRKASFIIMFKKL